MDTRYNLTRPAYTRAQLLSEVVPFGATTLNKLIKSGALVARKRGKSTVFLAPDIVAFLDSLPAKPPVKAA